VEHIACDNHIANHTPIKDLKYITPKEAWINIKPNIHDFCVFGNKAWAHILDEKRKHYSLQVRSEFLLDTLKM